MKGEGLRGRGDGVGSAARPGEGRRGAAGLAQAAGS